MKLITFHGSDIVHAADKELSPYCNQTDAARGARVQQVFGYMVSCRRCLNLIRAAGIARGGASKQVSRREGCAGEQLTTDQ